MSARKADWYLFHILEGGGNLLISTFLLIMSYFIGYVGRCLFVLDPCVWGWLRMNSIVLYVRSSGRKKGEFCDFSNAEGEPLPSGVGVVGEGVLAMLAVVGSIIEDGLLKTGLLLGPTISETLLLRSIALLDEIPRFQNRNHVHDSPVGS